MADNTKTANPARANTGIETLYRGIRFRSRLEARWAAFFDNMGWPWEYEPFDADGYIPNFVLLGDDPVLVEVKPAATLPELEAPLKRAITATAGRWQHDILAVGLSPLMPTDGRLCCGWDEPLLGLIDEWQHEGARFYGISAAHWIQCRECNLNTFHHSEASYRARLCGHRDGDHMGDADCGLIAYAWAEATNTSRWNAPVAITPVVDRCACGQEWGPYRDHIVDHTRQGQASAHHAVPPPDDYVPGSIDPRIAERVERARRRAIAAGILAGTIRLEDVIR